MENDSFQWQTASYHFLNFKTTPQAWNCDQFIDFGDYQHLQAVTCLKSLSNIVKASNWFAHKNVLEMLRIDNASSNMKKLHCTSQIVFFTAAELFEIN